MGFVGKFVRHPRQLWIRKLNFQIHLWAGLVVALYLIVVGMTGSILVFRQEIEAAMDATHRQSFRQGRPSAGIDSVLENVRAAYPGRPIISITTPSETDPRFVALVQARRGTISVAADPTTGRVTGEIPRQRSWLTVIRELHETLLAGRKGRMVNGTGGLILVLLNITGLVIWWPGIRTWKRAFLVDARRSWRRVNFDLHRAAGFWTLAITSFWGLSGFYFGWTRQAFALVNHLSPVVSARPPVVRVGSAMNVNTPDLQAMISRAYAFDPGTTFGGVEFPYSRRAPLEIFMRRRNGDATREYTDTLYFNPLDGMCLYIWRYGINESPGDWLIWLQVPLHYGTFWGLGIKIVWALAGLSIPLLTVTGGLMYWNRVLRRKWKRFATSSQSAKAAFQPLRRHQFTVLKI